MRDFRNYQVFQDSFALVKDGYQVISNLPESEKYGLRSQISRAVISIPSNIAEGASRQSEAEFGRFLEIAIGSSFELETQLLLTVELNFLPVEKVGALVTKVNEVQKQLNGFRSKLKQVKC